MLASLPPGRKGGAGGSGGGGGGGMSTPTSAGANGSSNENHGSSAPSTPPSSAGGDKGGNGGSRVSMGAFGLVEPMTPSPVAASITPIPRDHAKGVDPEDDSEHYIRNCDRYGMKVDPSIVIALRTRWHVMQPTRGFCEGYLLPLAGILDRNPHIRRLNLSGTGVTNVKPAAGNGDSNARVLHQVLASNTAIETLDVSNTGLDDHGVQEVCEGLKKNASVVALSLARNNFTSRGVGYIAAMLERNTSLRSLDISRNALGFHCIHRLQCCGHAHRVEMRVDGNYVFEEILNSLTHGLGFIASVVGMILLMSAAAEPGATPYHFWSCLLFSLCLTILYLSSTLYHSFFMLPYAKDILQVLDHVGIYLLIAGSYSPFMMIALHHNTPANVLLAVEWLTAFVGICVSIGTAGVGISNQATNLVEVLIFLAMGCAAFGIWGQLIVSLPLPALHLLVAGGLTYICGVPFFIYGEVKPIYHTVWHIFVMLGSLLHWLCIYNYIVTMDLDVVGK